MSRDYVYKEVPVRARPATPDLPQRDMTFHLRAQSISFDDLRARVSQSILQ